jgi:hypothetical protein
MRRIRVKTWIRTVAIAMIAFPEPITTVLGILILCASFAIFRPKKLSKFGDLEALVKKSLLDTEPAGFRRYVAARQKIVHHSINLYFPLPDQKVPENTGPAADVSRTVTSGNLAAVAAKDKSDLSCGDLPATPYSLARDEAPGNGAESSYHKNPWFDNRQISETVFHHTLRTSFPEYEAGQESGTNKNLNASGLKKGEPAVEHHTLKLSPVPETHTVSSETPESTFAGWRHQVVLHHKLIMN